MTKNIARNLMLGAVLAAIPLQAMAGDGSGQKPSAIAASKAQSIPGWDEFVDRLKALGPKMLSRLPADMQRDPQIRQEVARVMLESLAAGTIGAISADPDHPVFLPGLGLTLNVGQPNADTVYKGAAIAPGGTYRLRGSIGNVRIAKIGQMGFDPGKPSAITALRNDDLNTLSTDGDGRFDVILSPERPEGFSGDWRYLDPRTSRLLLRLVSADWAAESDPTISIERLDAPAIKPRPSAERLEKSLRTLPAVVDQMALLFVDHVSKLEDDGYVNKFKIFDVAAIGGHLEGQFYYETAYDLADDEALVIEAKVPAKCGYFSMILTNPLYETTDWYNNHSSLNDAQLHVDDDGILRIVVSARDPGIANWLDTAGYPQGVIQGRWTDCNAQPLPSIAKVKVSQVAGLLPKDTPRVSPEQREKSIRDRRSILQQRNLW